jgi:predicted flap endonuclease-1-like 5' DNA nuclease
VETPKPEALISSETVTPTASTTTNTVLAPMTAPDGLVALPDAIQETPSQTVLPSVDDLVIIEGIGPRRAEALVAAGITTFAQLAKTDTTKIEEIMTGAGLSLEPGIETWPTQADLLAKGDMTAFNALTVRLVAGRVTNDKKKKKSGDA